MLIHFLKGSIFDALIQTCILVGWPMSLITMSVKDRCAIGSYASLDSTVILPALISRRNKV